MNPSEEPANPADKSLPTNSLAHDDVRIADTSKEADKLPSTESLHAAETYEVLDREGKAHSFKSLYSAPSSTSRVLLIFIRHFFCGVSSSIY